MDFKTQMGLNMVNVSLEHIVLEVAVCAHCVLATPTPIQLVRRFVPIVLLAPLEIFTSATTIADVHRDMSVPARPM
jgi:hypothetical protein